MLRIKKSVVTLGEVIISRIQFDLTMEKDDLTKEKDATQSRKWWNFAMGGVQGLKSQEVISFDNEHRWKAVYNKRETFLKKFIIVILYSVSNCISYQLYIQLWTTILSMILKKLQNIKSVTHSKWHKKFSFQI